MGDAKTGKAFIRHEFDEAISVHKAIVEAERILAEAHPMPKAKTAITKMHKADTVLLAELRVLGKGYGATGKAEEVAKAMADLSKSTNRSADKAPSEAYEAHAVLLTMLRKQQDSASAVAMIATKLDDGKVKTAATKMHKAVKAEADELATLLGKFAVQIATRKKVVASR